MLTPAPKGRAIPMQANTDHIATSHVGSLPRPDALIAAHRAHEAGEPLDERAFNQTLREAVSEVVRHQHDIGIDMPGDGEFGKPMGTRIQYGSWWRYSYGRLGGLESSPNPARSIRCLAAPSGRGRTHQLRRSPRSQPIRRGLCRPRIRHHHRTTRACAAGVRRPDQLHRPRRDRGRHREFQGGDEGRRRRGRVHERDRARQCGAHRATPITRPTRNSSSPAPTRCARNTRRSSMPA